MKKPKIKIKQLKPKVKIISEATTKEEQESLEAKVEIAREDPRVVTDLTPSKSNPTLIQKFEDQEKPFEKIKEKEREQTAAITYQAMHQTSTRNYNPSIRPGNLSQAQASLEKVDPTLPVSSNREIQIVQGEQRNMRDVLRENSELELRRFNDQRDYENYQADQSVEKYVAKRRTDR